MTVNIVTDAAPPPARPSRNGSAVDWEHTLRQVLLGSAGKWTRVDFTAAASSARNQVRNIDKALDKIGAHKGKTIQYGPRQWVEDPSAKKARISDRPADVPDDVKSSVYLCWVAD